MDATQINLEKMEEGWVNMIIEQPIYEEGYLCAQKFHTLLTGGTVPDFEYIEEGFITQENLDEYIEKYDKLYERAADDAFFNAYK